MKIGIDVSILKRGGGVAVYISQLLSGLQAAGKNHEFVLYANFPNGKQTLNVPFPVVSTRIPDRILNFLWTELRFPPVSWLAGATDVFHSTAHSPVYAYSPPAKNWIVTVHDLFTFKLNYSQETQERERKVLKLMDRHAKGVIAVSHSTRNDLIEMVPGLESRTVVIHEGIDEKFFSVERQPQALRKYGITGPYILYVGAADAHKNLIRLVNAFKRLAPEIPHSLVLAGRMTERYRPVMQWVAEANLSDRVVFTDTVSEADLPVIYKGADLFVLPSLYEGFGLVLLEAMACGTPVAASNISSIPEVLGDTGALFDPLREDDIYETLSRVLSDPARLQTMQTRGIERARLFSWREMANQTLKFYEQAV